MTFGSKVNEWYQSKCKAAAPESFPNTDWFLQMLKTNSMMQHLFYPKWLITCLMLAINLPAFSQNSPSESPPAAESIPQIYMLSGGTYESSPPYSDYATLHRYLPASQTLEAVDTIYTQSAQDAVIQGTALFVAAQDSLVKYDITTQERLQAVALSNIAALGIQDSLLFVSRQDGISGAPSDSVFLKVLHAQDLSLVKNLEAVNDDAASIAFGRGKAWVAVNGGYASTTGGIAEVLLSDFSVQYHDLDTLAGNIQNVFVQEDTVNYVCPTPYGESYGKIGRYMPLQDSLAVDSLEGALGSAAGMSGNALQVIFDNAVRNYSMTRQQLTDTLASGEFTAATAYSGFLVALSTDYFSYGAMEFFDAAESRYDSVGIPISPETAVFDKRGLELQQTTALPDKGLALTGSDTIVLSHYFADPYNPEVAFTVETPEEGTAEVTQAHDTLIIAYSGSSNAPQDIAVTAHSGLRQEKDTFTVYSPVNHLPSIEDIYIATGGVFESSPPVTDYARVSRYDINSGTVNTFDTIYTQSVQDLKPWYKKSLYVAAQDSLIGYDQETHKRIVAGKVQQIKELALTADYILISRQDGVDGAPTDGSYVKVLDRQDLSEVADIPVSDQAAGIAVHNDSAFVAINGGWQGTEGKIAIINLNDFSFEEVNLGAPAKGIESIFYKHGKLHFICPTPWGETAGRIGSMAVSAGSATIDTIQGQLGATGHLRGDSLLVNLDKALAYYRLQDQQILATGVRGNFSAFATASHHYFGTSTDFFTYGQLEVFRDDGTKTNQIATGISPEGLAIDDFVQAGVNNTTEKPLEMRLYPNPASRHVQLESTRRINRVSLFSLDGKKLTGFRFSGKKARLNLTGIPRGIYLLQVHTAKEIATQKLVIE